MANRTIRTLVFGFVYSNIFLLMVNLNMAMVSQPLCQERYLQRPLGGKRCVTEDEGYIIKTGISQLVCTWHCLRNESCDVINYKTTGICLLSSGPCIATENEDQSIATVFSVNRPCLEWVAFSESERDNSRRLIGWKNALYCCIFWPHFLVGTRCIQYWIHRIVVKYSNYPLQR